MQQSGLLHGKAVEQNRHWKQIAEGNGGLHASRNATGRHFNSNKWLPYPITAFMLAARLTLQGPVLRQLLMTCSG